MSKKRRASLRAARPPSAESAERASPLTEAPPAHRRGFAAVALFSSVFLTVLAVEFGVRWSVQGSFTAALGTFFSDEVEVFGEGRSGGLIGDPELGFRLDPDEPGFNPLAIRDPAQVPPKQSGRPRLLVLGDSIAYVIDQGVPYRKGFVNVMREKLADRAEVINGAVPGYTTYQERMWFERLAGLEPDVVLLEYCLNDNHRFLHRFDPQLGMLATEEARHIFLPEQGDPLAWLPQRSYLAYRLRLALFQLGQEEDQFVWDRDIGFRAGWRDSAWPLFEQELTKLNAAVEEAGGKLALAVVPLAAQFEPAALEHDAAYVLKPQRVIAEIAGRLDVPALDLAPFYARGGDFGLYVGDGIHLNEKGHELTAAATLAFLEKTGLLGPR